LVPAKKSEHGLSSFWLWQADLQALLHRANKPSSIRATSRQQAVGLHRALLERSRPFGYRTRDLLKRFGYTEVFSGSVFRAASPIIWVITLRDVVWTRSCIGASWTGERCK